MRVGHCSGLMKEDCWKDNKAVHFDSWPLSALKRRDAVAARGRKVNAEGASDVAGHIRRLKEGMKKDSRARVTVRER